MGAEVKDFGAVGAAFAGRDITVIACYIEGQPVRSATAFNVKVCLRTGAIGLSIAQT